MSVLITIYEANDLIIGDLDSSDPYVLIFHNGNQKRTSVKPHTLNPVWNEKFTFDLDFKQPIEFHVYDKDFLKDDSLGKATFNIKEIQAKEGEEKIFKLPVTKGGQIKVSFTLKGCSSSDFNKSSVGPNKSFSKFVHYIEGNGPLAAFVSFVNENSQKFDFFKKLPFFKQEKQEENKLVEMTLNTVRKYEKYLSNGVENFYDNLMNGRLNDFEPNSFDSVVAMIVVGTHYGTESKEYKNVKEYILRTSTFDEKWVELLIRLIHPIKKYKNPHKPLGNFVSEDSDPDCYKIPEKCRIVMIADWASGSDGAINVLKEIDKLNPRPDILIHLGDVYYSGTLKENEEYFVNPIKQYLKDMKVYFIPGNHDYYAGTDGLEYSLSQFGQNASFFSLYNSYFQIQGLDTGYNSTLSLDPKVNTTVPETELEWHKNRTKQAINKGRKLVYLSHHQLFSIHEVAGHYQGKKAALNIDLFNQFEEYVDNVDAWYWGHIHGFDVSEPYTYKNHTIKRGRLIGNASCQQRDSGVEDYTTTKPISFETNELPIAVSKGIFPGTFSGLLNDTFVVLDVSPQKIVSTSYEIPLEKLGVYKPAKVLFEETFN